MRTMQVEFTSKEPGRLMTEIPNNSFARDSTVNPVNGDQVIAQSRPRRTFEQPSRPAKRRAEYVIHARCIRRRVGDRFWNSGFCMEPATRGPAAALQHRILSHAVQMQ